MADFDYFYTLQIGSNKKLVDYGPTQNRFPKLQKAVNLLEGIPSRGGSLAVYSDLDGTPATGTVTFTGTLSHGAGGTNAAFTFTAGSAGACTVTVGSHTGLTVTGSGTAATDATALAAVIQTALGTDFTVTANAGDVRIVATVKGGYNLTTTVTATGGGKLSAAGAALTGGNTGSLGNIVVKGVTVSLGSVASSALSLVSMAAIGLQAEAAVEASTSASLYVLASSAVVAGDAVITLTSKVPAPLEVLGNLITLTASVGTASGATLAGGVNATDNTSVY